MVGKNELIPSAAFRQELAKRGGGTATRCYQCATCTSVCDLTKTGSLFPRQQMLACQWGLADRLVGDPGVWLCHQCNDCTVSCPRDAKPGDVMQSVRSLAIEDLSAPRFMGHLVGNASRSWPLLLGLPIVFWFVLLFLVNGFAVPERVNYQILHTGADLSFVEAAYAQEGAHAEGHHGVQHVPGKENRLIYEEMVPHKYIYIVFTTAFFLALIAAVVGGAKFWKLLGRHGERQGSFVGALLPVVGEIATHKRFGSCEASHSRRWAHFSLLWGFVGAAFASFLLVISLYVTKDPLPLAQTHPYKIIGNISMVLLVVGALWLFVNRLADSNKAGASKAYDNFFLTVVALVVLTGALTELGAFVFPPVVAAVIYVVHLGTILTMFLTVPYSKFAHMVYRTLAMVHERMAEPGTVKS
jgi:quinone-modifying oxidoreductase subunit QmoC